MLGQPSEFDRARELIPSPAVDEYCTINEVRNQLQDIKTQLDEVLILRAVKAASRAIDAWCSNDVPNARKFWLDESASARYFRCENRVTVWFDDFGTTDGLIVQTDDDDDGVYETTWTLGADFQLGPINSAVSSPHAFWQLNAVGPSKRFPVYERRTGLKITAKWGWTATPVEVKQATLIRAVALFLRKDSPYGIAGSNEYGGMRISKFDTDVVSLLRPYLKRRPRTMVPVSSQGRYSLFHRRSAD